MARVDRRKTGARVINTCLLLRSPLRNTMARLMPSATVTLLLHTVALRGLARQENVSRLASPSIDGSLRKRACTFFSHSNSAPFPRAQGESANAKGKRASIMSCSSTVRFRGLFATPACICINMWFNLHIFASAAGLASCTLLHIFHAVASLSRCLSLSPRRRVVGEVASLFDAGSACGDYLAMPVHCARRAMLI